MNTIQQDTRSETAHLQRGTAPCLTCFGMTRQHPKRSRGVWIRLGNAPRGPARAVSAERWRAGQSGWDGGGEGENGGRSAAGMATCRLEATAGFHVKHGSFAPPDRCHNTANPGSIVGACPAQPLGKVGYEPSLSVADGCRLTRNMARRTLETTNMTDPSFIAGAYPAQPLCRSGLGARHCGRRRRMFHVKHVWFASRNRDRHASSQSGLTGAGSTWPLGNSGSGAR